MRQADYRDARSPCISPTSERRGSPAIVDLYRSVRRDGPFERGIQAALQLILASPRFVFRTEQDPANVGPGGVYPLGDLELASRLSFFLWSSIPDDELLDRGESGQAAQIAPSARAAGPADAGRSAVRSARQQFRRPVAAAAQSEDRRAELERVPRFRRQPAAGVRGAKRELFFESVMREDRSVLDLLTADYTFVNERLAQPLRDSRTSTAASSAASRSARRRSAAGLARPGQHPDGDLVRRPARRRSSAASGCSKTFSARRRRRRRRTCPPLKENETGGTPKTHARADGAASGEPGVRELPQA